MVVNKVVLRARAVYNLNSAVILSVVADIVDYGTERSKTYTAGDEEKILSLEVGFNRKRLTVRTADGDFLSDVHHVEPFCKASALLNGEFHIFTVCGRGCYGEHSLAYTGN